MLGSGAMVVMAEGTDLLAAATNVLASSATSRAASASPAGWGPPRRTPCSRRARRRRGPGRGPPARCSSWRRCCAGRRSAASARWHWARWSASSDTSAVARRPAPSPGTRTRGHAGARVLHRPDGRGGTERVPARRRTAVEVVALADALSRVPAEDGRTAPPCPASRGRPSTGSPSARPTPTACPTASPAISTSSVRSHGPLARRRGQAGHGVAIPTGGALPPGADAVVMVEYTQEAMPGTVEVVRPAAPGDGMVRADEDVAPGARLVPAGRPLRAQDLGLLAAAGIREVRVRARPTVAILSTGDEVVPATTGDLLPGQVRDATAIALAALVTGGGGTPDRGIVPDDAAALDRALRAALATCDLAVVSAGSSVGARDETRRRHRGPRAARHLLPRPRDPPGQAHGARRVRGVPVIGLPGNPLSALVVFRLVGLPVLRLVGGCLAPPPEPGHARAAGARGPVGRGAPGRRAGAPVPRGGRAGVRALGAAVGAGLGGRLRGRARGRHRSRRRVRGDVMLYG